MLVLHFGDIRPHRSGKGTVGDFALHVQCSWRFDGPSGIVTGRDDLWDYGGPQKRPEHWSHEDGRSMQDHRLSRHFVRDESTGSWINESTRFVVTRAELTQHGEINLALSDGYAITIFPASFRLEAWRLFEPGMDSDHLVFPAETTDFAITRRETPRSSQPSEVQMKIVEAPSPGTAMQAPPTLILSVAGTRYLCGHCGSVLAIAESGTLKGFVIHCLQCEHYNEVGL